MIRKPGRQKKTNEERLMEEKSPETVRLNLNLEVDVHQRLKMYAVEQRTTIAYLIREAIDNILAEAGEN
jgi:predicted DNA-binding protein